MIVTELYNGQGLGNQLWSYVVTRVIAMDNNINFGILGAERFKGKDFLNLDFGVPPIGGSSPEGGPPIHLPDGIEHYYAEKEQWYPRFNCDVRDYDINLLHISKNTKIEGYFQSEKYIAHRRETIRNWLKINKIYNCTKYASEDVCVMNIRGGEYRAHKELLLPKTYWENAMQYMKASNPNMRFVIVTDDTKYTSQLFPDLESLHSNMGTDYSRIHNSKYLILANSSFAFFPAWTSQSVRRVIAPKYWARHNISDGFWACAFNLYRDWEWLDRSGRLHSYQECVEEYSRYSQANRLNELSHKQYKNTYFLNLRKIVAGMRKKIRGY
jgi:hypothetical protein